MWELILRDFVRVDFAGPSSPGMRFDFIPLFPGEVSPRAVMNQYAFRGRTKLEAAEKAVRAIESIPLQNTSTLPTFRCLYAAAATAATQERNKTFPPGSPLLAVPFSQGCTFSWRYISPVMRMPGLDRIFSRPQRLIPTAVGRAMNRLRAPTVMTGFQTAGCCGGTVPGCGGPACGGAGCKPAVGCKEPTAVGTCLQYVYTDPAGSGCGYSTPCDIGCGIGC